MMMNLDEFGSPGGTEALKRNNILSKACQLSQLLWMDWIRMFESVAHEVSRMQVEPCEDYVANPRLKSFSFISTDYVN